MGSHTGGLGSYLNFSTTCYSSLSVPAIIRQASIECLPYDKYQRSHIYRMHFLEAQLNREPGGE